MMSLRTTAIMKTDISGSTPKFRELLGVDLEALLREHKAMVDRLASARGGRLVKPEGDGFWLAFPSVTAAALAAIDMQEELRLAQPGRSEGRLAMRIVLTLGDVLHQDGALIGDAIVLATRIESITPSDEIYLCAAAKLVLNPAEVRTAFVSEFSMDGFPEPVAVYRVEQTHRTQTIDDQYIVHTDLRGFGAFAKSSQTKVVERILDRLFELVTLNCRTFGGANRLGIGDGYFLTFPEADQAMSAAEQLMVEWDTYMRKEDLPCFMNVAVHMGTLFAYRSYLYGIDLDITEVVERTTKHLSVGTSSVFVTGKVRGQLLGTPWAQRMRPIEVSAASPHLDGQELYQLRMGYTQPFSAEST
jgi:class 3 adenylate cyclase